MTWASFIHRYSELGGGDVPAFAWTTETISRRTRGLGEVDTVDGFVLGLSPWVVRNVRFDESLGRAARLRLRLLPSGPGGRPQGRDGGLQGDPPPLAGPRSDPETWVAAHMRIAEKWDGRMPRRRRAGGDWKHRARRAEAEAAAVNGQRSPAASRATPGARARAPDRGHGDEHRLADHRAAAQGQPLARLPARSPRRPQRRSLALVLRQQAPDRVLVNAGSPRGPGVRSPAPARRPGTPEACEGSRFRAPAARRTAPLSRLRAATTRGEGRDWLRVARAPGCDPRGQGGFRARRRTGPAGPR